jgi:hypothetical protein
VPACKIIVAKMLEHAAVRETENVPLSDSKINSHIDISHDAEEILRDKRKNKCFYMQVVESTDFTNESVML